MNKDNNSKWNFVEMPPNVPSRSGEDSTFDHFRSKPYRFIVREFIQNSMDESTLESGIFENPCDYHVHWGWFAAKDSSRENICKNHL